MITPEAEEQEGTPHAPGYRLLLDARVMERYPAYSALIIYARNLFNGPSDAWSTSLLRQAEQQQRESLSLDMLATVPSIFAWREAYKSFGAKPKKYPSSLESLLTRTLKRQDIPTINRLVDVYNAISVKHLLPVGGEDWEQLRSDLVLTVATGSEPFLAMQDGVKAVTYPEPGEIIWADRAGVTCRRWNWRQGLRTRLTEKTRHVYFVLDRLAPYSLEALRAAGDDLMEHLKQMAPQCTLSSALLGTHEESPA
jgi:DNA/RNA-binding domain of Phe-tRNA-synthetase-like protein